MLTNKQTKKDNTEERVNNNKKTKQNYPPDFSLIIIMITERKFKLLEFQR